ncbi:GNAT family N-acetyltransferase [uncultured Thalassospira sp.]|uniref:GNAT family N-acetyltransferase n=1 Tax=uncultured Thalassospira sp. TaxID=404382 RepID=UPI00258D3D37|nr:GNAT family N-acetyltransferase [uncultured Thalassospira sp.]
MMFETPRLETQRLVLRSMCMDDWPSYCTMMGTGRSKYMGGPFDHPAAWGMFCQDIAQWHLFGVGALMIDEKSSGRCVGQVGINSGPLFPEYELGWFVYGDTEGKGIAFEAAQILRNWAFAERGLSTLVSYIDPENDRSIALAERLGAVLDQTAQRPDPTDLVFRHKHPA